MHDAMKAYHESWERDLDRQFLKTTATGNAPISAHL